MRGKRRDNYIDYYISRPSMCEKKEERISKSLYRFIFLLFIIDNEILEKHDASELLLRTLANNIVQ